MCPLHNCCVHRGPSPSCRELDKIPPKEKQRAVAHLWVSAEMGRPESQIHSLSSEIIIVISNVLIQIIVHCHRLSLLNSFCPLTPKEMKILAVQILAHFSECAKSLGSVKNLLFCFTGLWSPLWACKTLISLTIKINLAGFRATSKFASGISIISFHSLISWLMHWASTFLSHF